MGVLLKGKGDLITKDMKKAKGVFDILTLIFIGKTCLQEFQGNKNLLKHI